MAESHGEIGCGCGHLGHVPKGDMTIATNPSGINN